jgi:hypothetical protein
MNVAPRYITGAEVSLITLLETVLGPVIVFFWFGEVPGVFTLLGGGLLLATLTAHELVGLNANNDDKSPDEEKLRASFDSVKYSFDSTPTAETKQDLHATTIELGSQI